MEIIHLQFTNLQKVSVMYLLHQLVKAAEDLGSCAYIIASLGVTTNGGETMNINDENGVPKGGLKGDSPGCTYIIPGNAKDGRNQLLVRGSESPACDSPFRSWTGRRRVCACDP